MKHWLRWTFVAGLLGLVAPLIWFFPKTFGANPPYSLERIIRIAWPSSFWLMATEGIEGTPKDYAFISLSVLANVAAYALVGVAAWWLKQIASLAKR